MAVVLSDTLIYTFIALGALMCILLLVLISKISGLTNALEQSFKSAPVPSSASTPLESALISTAKNSVTFAEPKLIGVDEETAAMLMAIVADELKVPVEQLDFISIKETNA